MCIRDAHLNDLDALIQLEQYFPSDRLNRKSFKHLLRKGHAQVWVCEKDDVIIADAVVLYRRHVQYARLYSLVVHPAHQQRGIARDLMTAAESAVGAHGCCELRLEVRSDNVSAIRFYEKAGYKKFVRLVKYYEDGADALKMTKTLASASADTIWRSQPPQCSASGASCPTS